MSQQTLAVTTIKNSVLNIASFILGLGINFYLLRFVVAQIGIDAYGISALLFVIIAPLSLTNLGFGEATTKYVAEFVHASQYEKAGAYIRTTFFMNLMVGLLGAILVFLFGGNVTLWAFSAKINPTFNQTIYDCMKVIACGWIINQCAATFMGVPVALQHFKRVAIGNTLQVLVTAMATYVLLKQQWGLLGFTIATVTGQLFGLIYWFVTAKKLMPNISLSPAPDKDAWKKSFHYGGWQTISQLGGILAQQAEKYVMGVLLSTASVGIYHVALNIEQKVYTVVHKLAEVLFPMFSAISNDTDERKANILIKSTWVTTTAAVGLLVSVVPFTKELITLWMKNADIANSGSFVLQVLCLAGAFGSATTAGYFFLLGVGKTQKITYISVLTGMVTVVVSLIVLPIYGLKGAGISALAAAVVQSLAISRVMNTALKNTIPLAATLNAVYTPILTGTCWALFVAWFNPFVIEGWLVLGVAYIIMLLSTIILIYLATRILPYGKAHEELLIKLFAHLTNKIKQAK
ncbi:MAG: oligosaccharide flippase family protein [Bacteroidota bacterium]